MKLDRLLPLEPESARRRLAAMDDKTINLWRQIEGARRIGTRRVAGAPKPDALPLRPPANDLV